VLDVLGSDAGASFASGAGSDVGIPFMGREISIGDAARALDPVLDAHVPENDVVVLVG